MEPPDPNLKIREIDRDSEIEIALVASRLRQTLVEVLGEEKGTGLYSMEWLLDRIRFHLDPQETKKIFLVDDDAGHIRAQAIARVEREGQSSYGYFSTIFVEPNFRNQGLATRLILHVESWFRRLNMPKIIYNTADNHTKLIRLFERHGYRITLYASEMVQLTKELKVNFLKSEEYQPLANRVYSELKEKLGFDLPAAQIEHIGSSAIPGCLSKGDLDIYVAVPALDFSNAIKKIESLGFNVKQNTERTEELCPFEGSGFPLDVGLQLVARGSKFEFFLTFRDVLLNDERLRDEYNRLKQRCSGFEADEYRKVKSAFIDELLARRK